MIRKMHISNFKCFKDFEIELGPFNVLVGPNDSGKTTLLQAIALVSACGRRGIGSPNDLANDAGITLGPSLVWQKDPSLNVSIVIKGLTEDTSLDSAGAVVRLRENNQFWVGTRGEESISDHNITAGKNWVSKVVGKAKYYLFNPDALRKPSQMSSGEAGMSLKGDRFPTFLVDLVLNDREAFFELEKRFYQRFPHYESIELGKSGANNILSFRMKSGPKLDAGDVSDGAILYLAYLAVTHEPDPPRILLIEEPENGVHPSGLKATVEALQHISKEKDVQVILTTHSPYLLDLVEPEEVRVFAKDEEGAVHAAKLSDHPEVEDLKKHFMTGEIWTEFDEADIVAKRETAK